MEISNHYNIGKICRACLEEKQNMSSLFEEENAKVFTSITSLIIDNNKMPSLICSQCKTDMNIAYNFKQLCLKSEQILEQYTTQCKLEDIKLNLSELTEQLMEDLDQTENTMDTSRPKKRRLARKNVKIEKLFKCNQCAESFDLKCLKILKRHVRIHMKSKPFKCEICRKSFSESGSLTRHLRKHRGEKRHLCVVCGKGFYESNVLAVHMRIHTGEKPIECYTCNKRFSDPNGLRSHLKSHTGEKNYTCEICSKSFAHSFVLKKHLRVHSGERPYLCSVCGKSFTQCDKVLVLLLRVRNAGVNG